MLRGLVEFLRGATKTEQQSPCSLNKARMSSRPYGVERPQWQAVVTHRHHNRHGLAARTVFIDAVGSMPDVKETLCPTFQQTLRPLMAA